MRVWRYHGVDRLVWVVLALLVLAVAVFAMAAGFSRLRSGASPIGTGEGAVGGPAPPAHLTFASGSEMKIHETRVGGPGPSDMPG
jgi:hypothetical protein